MVVLTLKAKHDHLQKVANTRDPIKALAEFVWNALDGDATEVSIEFIRNSLGGLESIVVRDNGTGISKERAERDFESLGESWKLRANRTPVLSRAMHGKEGQGRFRFFSLAHKARWESIYKEKDKLLQIVITIDADKLQTCDVSDPGYALDNSKTGTLVELSPLKDTFDWLTSEEARADFNATFAQYVLQYPGIIINFDGKAVDPNSTIERTYTVETKPIICSGRTIKDLTLKIIEWKVRVGSRKIYFGAESGVVLGSQAANIPAPGFDFSVYAYSPFFQEIAAAHLLEFDGLTDSDFARILEYIRDVSTEYFRARQTEKSSELIQDLKAAGIYPYEGEPKNDVEHREREFFDMATHAVASYSREFKKADNSLKKITLSLLREQVSRNPDSISRIMNAEFNLPKARQDEFSSLLEKTELGHIISAGSLIADRIAVLKVLREIVFEPKHRRTIKERGELDVLIRDNTWIFGENFHFTMPEVGLTKVMERVSTELSLKRRQGKGRKLDGKIGRVDAFMGRIVPHPDYEKREFLLIELKRPSLKIGRKELDQLEDYVNAIIAQPDFLNTSTYWNFFLIGSEYDEVVKEKITQQARPMGIYTDQINYKVWVKSWAEIIQNCEGRHEFIQRKLQIQVSDKEISQRISQLKNSLLNINLTVEDTPSSQSNKKSIDQVAV